MKKIPRFTYRILLLLALVILPSGLPGTPFSYGVETGNQAGAPAQGQTLSFQDRVAYQRAIEEVYWYHRIWPKENTRPKPSLDEVMSSAAIEKKVADYLRDSQVLEDQRHQPITPGELQAEMQRMANHTKQPDVLHELFVALGNDPLVIAECLVRPTLTARLAESFQAGSNAGLLAENRAYKLPDISVPLDCADDTWTPTTTVNAPVPRIAHTAIWTGAEMIIFGGLDGLNYVKTGSRYNPSTDTWSAISNAAVARGDHSAIWTGTVMIVWGGEGGENGPPVSLNSGSAYNPTFGSFGSWSNISTPALSARGLHTAVWTGREMIVWGGNGQNTGGRYNPDTSTWILTSTANAPAGRTSHTAVWTGSEMIVWGGAGDNNVFFNSGGKYDPNTDSWSATSLADAAGARSFHTAVWTGNEMIVWGGAVRDPNLRYLNTGGKYNPSTDSWASTSMTNVPAQRAEHTAIWTGVQMIVWGGGFGNFASGGRYNPGADSWTATTLTGAPQGREAPSAVWTGTQMIVWGGNFGGPQNTGGRYCAQPNAPIVVSAVSRKSHGMAGNFDVNLPLSGPPAIECRSSNATNDHTMVVTFLANVSIEGTPRAQVTSGTAAIGSNGISNGGAVTIAGNIVKIPLTNVANAQTLNVTLNSVNGSTNVTIPMSVLVGDVNGNGLVNASDAALTKSRVGQAIDGTNFRSDVNANGTINVSDVSLVKSAIGTALP